MTSNKIGVCLLTFNHAEVIESTIESILNQTIDDCEIVISDDCSTDGTWERVCEIARRSPRVRAVQTPSNMGMAGNANFAVAQLRSEYIALLHHDDLYRPDLLEKWAGVLDRHPSALFVFNAYGRWADDGVDSETLPQECVDGEWFLRTYLLPRWGCPVRGTAMIRRAAWVSARGMREEFALLSDVDLWMRLAMMGSVGYVGEPLIVVRHARPATYPSIYRYDMWSWERLSILYAIHGDIRKAYLDLHRFSGRVQWALFRIRVSAETAKWIAYAWVRGKRDMLRDCNASRSPYDLCFLQAFRKLALRHATRTTR